MQTDWLAPWLVGYYARWSEALAAANAAAARSGRRYRVCRVWGRYWMATRIEP